MLKSYKVSIRYSRNEVRSFSSVTEVMGFYKLHILIHRFYSNSLLYDGRSTSSKPNNKQIDI